MGESMKGWVIIKDHFEEQNKEYDLPSRKGWGQTSSRQVIEDGNQIFLRTITMREDIDPSDIENPVRFNLEDEDGERHYTGLISREWLESDEVLAFAPLNFAETDTGATIMMYCDPETSKWEML